VKQLRDPLEILGIKESSSKDDIKERYSILMKRYKAYKTDPENTSLDFDINEVNEAYNKLMGYDIKAEDPNRDRKRPILRMFGIDPSRFDNFWLYNKTKILVFCVTIGLVLSLVLTIINNKPKDFYIKVIGGFYVADETAKVVSDRIDADIPEVERALVDTSFTGSPEDTQYIMTIMQKFAAEIAAKEVDIVLCDWDKFNLYLEQGVFMKLDGLMPQALLEKNQKYYFDGIMAETEEVKGYFGINAADWELFKDIGIYSETGELILCIVVNTQRIDTVKSFIDRYIAE
jgi:hypothetical protein